MAVRYRLSSPAETDLKEIIEYVASDSLDSALRMIEAFEKRFELIAEQPGIGERYQQARRRLRRTSVGRYLIFYEESPEGPIIARVLHGARDYDRFL